MTKEEKTSAQKSAKSSLRLLFVAHADQVARLDPGIADRILENTATVADYLRAIDLLSTVDPGAASELRAKAEEPATASAEKTGEKKSHKKKAADPAPAEQVSIPETEPAPPLDQTGEQPAS